MVDVDEQAKVIPNDTHVRHKARRKDGKNLFLFHDLTTGQMAENLEAINGFPVIFETLPGVQFWLFGRD